MKSAALVLALLRFAMAFPNDCPNVTVTHSVADGWNAGCLGLKFDEDSTTALGCKKACYSNVNCSVWQWVHDKHNKGGDPVYKCWRGNDVHGCRNRAGKEEEFAGDLKDGERVQHGAVKVLANNTFIFYEGLHWYEEDTGNETEKIARCKLACYTTVACSVWQYNKDGCYIEDSLSPLTSANKASPKTEGDIAKTMNNGQTIEHYCPFYVPPEPEEGLPWAWIISGIVLGLLALAAILYSMKKTPKVKKTRAVTITPKKEEPEEEEIPVRTVYFVPQPTVLIPQTSVIQPSVMQPTVTYAAPTTTYAAPTTSYMPIM